jgi:hypothetical protein
MYTCTLKLKESGYRRKKTLALLYYKKDFSDSFPAESQSIKQYNTIYNA